MNRSGVAYLLTETYMQNQYGVIERTVSKDKVFVKVASVTGQEWFEGGRNGLNPQFRFTMFSHDYSDENILEYEDKQYTIYRTYYKTVDEIELYTELRKGNENPATTSSSAITVGDLGE